jgi:2'-5' RNA ligase
VHPEDHARAVPTQTAVVVPVPAAEPVVGPVRERLDRAAGWGVPAHVTVLYPFVLPGDAERSVTALGAAVRSVPAFDCAFATTGWFGRDVLWLAPEPAEPFRRLTRAVWSAFPAHPPYAGEHDGSTPHLTVAERTLADERGLGAGALDLVEAALLDRLPLHAHVDHVLLLAGAQQPGSWRTLHRLPLGEPA